MTDLIIALNPGYVFDETSGAETLTPEKLNRMMQDGSATILSGKIQSSLLADQLITTAKLNTTLSFAGITVTNNTVSATDEQFRTNTGAAENPDSAGQIGIATSTLNIYIAKNTTSWALAGTVIAKDVSNVADYKGQMSYSAGVSGDEVIHIAKDKLLVADWTKTLPINSLEFENNAADPTGLANKTTIWKNGDQLYYRIGTGSAIALTGAAPISGASTPDWDSGWIAVASNTSYDLEDTGSGGFSENSDITSVTGYAPSDSSLSFRICQSFFRPTTPASTTYIAVGSWTHQMGSGDGWYTYYDNVTGKLYLQTQPSWVWVTTGLKNPSPIYTNWVADNTHNAGEIRLKGWV